MAGPRRLKYDPYLDYYVVLGISPTAAPAEVQRAYRTRAKELHPDRNTSENATAQFQLLNEAYETLRDPEQRDLYNLLRQKHTGDLPPRVAWADRDAAGPGAGPGLFKALSGLLSGPYRMIILILVFVGVINVFFIIYTAASNANQNALNISQTLEAAVRPQVGEPTPACDPRASISAPRDGSIVALPMVIRGTARGNYQIDWTAANIEADGRIQVFEWKPLTVSDQPIEAGELAGKDKTSALPVSGRIRFRLIVGEADCEVTVTVRP